MMPDQIEEMHPEWKEAAPKPAGYHKPREFPTVDNRPHPFCGEEYERKVRISMGWEE